MSWTWRQGKFVKAPALGAELNVFADSGKFVEDKAPVLGVYLDFLADSGFSEHSIVAELKKILRASTHYELFCHS
jgi:hypothetical protein